MIPIGTPGQQVEPKHARAQYNALTEKRDYAHYVCPGQHCAGRMRVHEHRHTFYAVHTLSPAQAEAADRVWTR